MADIPDKVYIFINADGRIMSTSPVPQTANDWLKHRKVGDSVVCYKLDKVEKRERGK